MDRIIYPIYFNQKPTVPINFESWKLIDEEGVIKDYYYISNFGRVKNKEGQFLKPQLINSGYLTYRLYTGSLVSPRYKTFLAHRLVMQYFHPIPNPKEMTVNHDDLDKFNNYDDNLSWMTQKENNDYKFTNKDPRVMYTDRRGFSNDQLLVIFEELDKGTSYKDILLKLGLPDTYNMRDYVGNIKRGKTYKEDRKEYQASRFRD